MTLIGDALRRERRGEGQGEERQPPPPADGRAAGGKKLGLLLLLSATAGAWAFGWRGRDPHPAGGGGKIEAAESPSPGKWQGEELPRRATREKRVLPVAGEMGGEAPVRGKDGEVIRSRASGGGGPGMQLLVQTAQEQVAALDIRGVRVGAYSAKALIDGQLVTQGGAFRHGQCTFIFKGVENGDLLFEDSNGEVYRRTLFHPPSPAAAEL